MRSRVWFTRLWGLQKKKHHSFVAESVSVPKCDADGEQQMAFDYNRRVYQPDTGSRAFTTCTHATCRWSHPSDHNSRPIAPWW